MTTDFYQILGEYEAGLIRSGAVINTEGLDYDILATERKKIVDKLKESQKAAKDDEKNNIKNHINEMTKMGDSVFLNWRQALLALAGWMATRE